jgi:hypothetical protein
MQVGFFIGTQLLEIPSCDGRGVFPVQRLKATCAFEFLDLESFMGEVVRFIPKSELERVRLIREARAIYESVFPTQKSPPPSHSRPRRKISLGESSHSW